MKFRDSTSGLELSYDLAVVFSCTLHSNGGLTTQAHRVAPESYRRLVEQTLRIRQPIEIVDLEDEPDWVDEVVREQVRGLVCAPIGDRSVLVLGFRSTLARVDEGLISCVIALHQQLHDLSRHLRGRDDLVSRWVGSSTAHEAILRKVDIAASTHARVVILGPPGSGRMALARSIVARRGRGSVTRSKEAALRFQEDVWVTTFEDFEGLPAEEKHLLDDLRIEVPPLAERIEDAIVVAESELDRELDPGEVQALKAHDWPGNFRELRFAIWKLENLGVPLARQTGGGAVLTETQLRELEKENIERALDACDGTVYGQNGAAAMLELNATTLASRIKSLGIDR